MGYVSVHAYDADVRLTEFRGLNQAYPNLNPDIRYAAVAENVETPDGVLQPQAAFDILPGGTFEHRVETLAILHRRWYSGQGSKNWYVCSSGGRLYERQEGSGANWQLIGLGTEAPYNSDVWSCVTYEINTQDGTIDVLLMSNAQDGMIMVIPPDRPSIIQDYVLYTISDLSAYTINELVSPSWTVQAVDTRADPTDPSEVAKKFSVIERFGERIWGAGVPEEPDMLVYSRPYDPTDWTAAGSGEQPEDGAGDILQPSWDGDKFYALKRFGDQLLAVKNYRIWRVMGLSPGEYTFSEQFGDGTEYFNTIAVAPERVYMVGDDGPEVFDGMSTTPYARDQIKSIWRTVNKEALHQMCAVLHKDKYYLAFPTNDSEINNAMLVFDLKTGNVLFYKDFYVEAFLNAESQLFATSSTLPGQIIILNDDSWVKGASTGAPVKWETPWMDFGLKTVQKGGFDFYFLPEVQEEAVTFTISIETEKKKKTKEYTVLPSDKEHRQKRLHFGGSGRRFRIIIETAVGVTAPWRIIGGLHLVVETDPD